MSNKTPALIASVLTVILLLLIAVLSVFGQMILLNGASEKLGTTAMGISLACQGAGLILSAIIASRLTRLFLEKFNWNKIIAVIAAVFAGTLFGGILSFLSIIVSILIAEIR